MIELDGLWILDNLFAGKNKFIRCFLNFEP